VHAPLAFDAPKIPRPQADSVRDLESILH